MSSLSYGVCEQLAIWVGTKNILSSPGTGVTFPFTFNITIPISSPIPSPSHERSSLSWVYGWRVAHDTILSSPGTGGTFPFPFPIPIPIPFPVPSSVPSQVPVQVTRFSKSPQQLLEVAVQAAHKNIAVLVVSLTQDGTTRPMVRKLSAYSPLITVSLVPQKRILRKKKILRKDPRKNMEKIRTVRGCHSSNFESILLTSLQVTNDTDKTFRSRPLYIYRK